MWRIPVDHFDPFAGQRAALGRGRIPPRPLEELLTEHSRCSRGNLKRRLYAAGLKPRRCELCGQGEEWHGGRMALILDHINGVSDDNRLENLRIVCPHCAATLDTHCGRNIRNILACPGCGRMFRSRDGTRHCSQACAQRSPAARAARRRQRRVERPPYEQLLAEIAATSWSAVRRKYGVSDNAVRKWVRAYEAERAAGAAVAVETDEGGGRGRSPP